MTQEQLIAKDRRSLLIYAQRNGVTKACTSFGISRTTFYKIKRQFIATGSLLPRKRRRPKMPNEIALSKKKLLLKFVKEHPSWGTSRYAYEFKKLGIFITQQCLWHHLKKFDLNKRYKRLIYLEKLKEQKQPVTERSLRIIKKQCYKIKEDLWPGHIVALDTFYVGHIKGIGRIYQITGIDICSRYGWAKLYLSKDQESTTDFLENTLIPKFFHNNVELESVLTDNGTEFTAAKFNQLLSDYDIIHHRIPKGQPLYNGYCERFQRTIYEEFYQKAFRRKFFKSITALQADLDNYLVFYNFQRAHFGIIKTGAIPIDVFKSKIDFLRQRFSKIVNLTC